MENFLFFWYVLLEKIISRDVSLFLTKWSLLNVYQRLKANQSQVRFCPKCYWH